MVRGVFVTAIFRKSLCLDHEALKDDATLALISTDIEGIDDCLSLLPDFVASVFELGTTLVMLWLMIGPAAMLPLLPAIST